MLLSPDKGRAVITSALSALRKVYDVAPMSVALSLFKDAKFDELVNLYSKASTDERTSVYELLEPIYPAEQTRLDQIKKGSTK
jgi:hypothetical protein